MRRLAAVVAVLSTILAACGGDRSTANPLDGLASADGRRATYLVFFDGPPDLSGPAATADRAARGEAVVGALRDHARAAQADAVALADEAGVEVTSHWVANALAVEGSSALGAALEDLPGVTRVVEDATGRKVEHAPRPADAPAPGAPTWSVAASGAPDVWDEGTTGAGVVVATIDTGVDGGHPALAGSMRARRSWFDATGSCTDGPCDDVGHGTATMGLLVGGGAGQPGIGVAPGAEWVAAKACDASGCAVGDLWAAAEFLLAPTDAEGSDPDPSARPDVVNLSLELPPGTVGLDPLVEAFAASGVAAVFAVGNGGPGCATVGEPAAGSEAFAVAAVDQAGEIDPRSSRGPGDGDASKPDVAAPGVAVTSSAPEGGYVQVSGSSMAAPVVAGAAALALSTPSPPAADAVLAQVRATARPEPTTACSTSGTPNSTYGSGVLDVAALVEA